MNFFFTLEIKSDSFCLNSAVCGFFRLSLSLTMFFFLNMNYQHIQLFTLHSPHRRYMILKL